MLISFLSEMLDPENLMLVAKDWMEKTIEMNAGADGIEQDLDLQRVSLG